MLDSLDPRLKVLLGVATSLGVKYALAALMRYKRNERFELVGHVEELFCYPVKSCQGIQIQEAECTNFGLKVKGFTDRYFILLFFHTHLCISCKFKHLLTFFRQAVRL